MIDIAKLREDPEAVRENIKKKFQDHKLPLVDEAIALDKEYRETLTKASEYRASKNTISKSIGALMREGKKEEAEAAKTKVKRINDELPVLEEKEKVLFLIGQITSLIHQYLLVKMIQRTWK